MSTWARRSIISRWLTLGVLLSATEALAQKATTSGSTAGNAGSATTGTRTNPTNNTTLNPNNPNNTTTDGTLSNRPIFLSGRVAFDDGSPMNPNVQIQRVCGTNIQIESHADNKGRFSFQVGGSSEAALSAADASNSGLGSLGQQRQSSPFGGTSTSSKNTESALWGCDLQASYPGYRSETISLAGRRSLDNPDVGTILLHRLTAVQGTTISLTTALAPKGALKNYEKGMEAGQKGKFDEAEEHLVQATTAYPKFAVAWFALGQMQQRANKLDDARKSYAAAIEADKKYVSPYDQLALLAARENKWDEAANYSQQAIDLNPVEFPSSFWYNTVSNYNLKKENEALKSAQALVKLDVRHHYPEVNRILADILLQRQDYSAAAGYLRTYLELAPSAKDADFLKQQLTKVEAASAETKK